LYLRPTMIATNPDLALVMPTSALLFLIASPVGSYYKSGFKAITMETVPSVRAWPGGVGDFKVGPNYGPSVVPHHQAHLNGSNQTLWLIDGDRITEANGMNIFAVIRSKDSEKLELATPPLDGLILPGVTRDSVLKLAREKLASSSFHVSERKLTMMELQEASSEGRLRELFGTGTAVVILPVRLLKWKEKGVAISCGLNNDQEAGDVATAMKRWIEDVQFGQEKHEWGVSMPLSK
jgi:branched-chain amino acid aminotransferase